MSEEEYNLFSEHKNDYKKELGVATVGGTLGAAGYGIKKVAENNINMDKALKKGAKAANIEVKKDLNERLSEAKDWKETYKAREANYPSFPELKEKAKAQKKYHKAKLKKLGKKICNIKEVLKHNEGVIERANNRIKSAKKGVKLGKTGMAAGGLLVTGSTIAAGKKLLDEFKDSAINDASKKI